MVFVLCALVVESKQEPAFGCDLEYFGPDLAMDGIG